LNPFKEPVKRLAIRDTHVGHHTISWAGCRVMHDLTGSSGIVIMLFQVTNSTCEILG
jgi:hypothetical protein